MIGPPRALVEGQRLDQPTFHELYEAMPPGTRAELINGVVLMPSPVGPLTLVADGKPTDVSSLLTAVWMSLCVADVFRLATRDASSTAQCTPA